MSAPSQFDTTTDADTRADASDANPVRSSRRRVRDLVIVLVGIAVGIAMVLGVRAIAANRASGGAVDADVQAAVDGTNGDGSAAEQPAPDTDAPRSAADDAGAATPRDAVAGFLTAESEGRIADSFTFLSAADRRDLGSASGWVAAHADVLPPVTGFEIGDVTRDGDRAEVDATVAFEPGLDEVLGLTPAQGSATWVVNRADSGRWGIAFDDSTVEPEYPSDDEAAVAAARDWAQARQQCADAPGEWSGGLLGSPAVAEKLCGADGAVEIAPATALSDVDAPAITAAFGPDAGTWARVVPVTAPEPLRVVLAPVGDRWMVVGALQAAAR